MVRLVVLLLHRGVMMRLSGWLLRMMMRLLLLLIGKDIVVVVHADAVKIVVAGVVAGRDDGFCAPGEGYNRAGAGQQLGRLGGGDGRLGVKMVVL